MCSMGAAGTTCGQWALLRQHVVNWRCIDKVWSIGTAETIFGQWVLLRQHVVNWRCIDNMWSIDAV
jgi:hypothetical protein